MRFQFPTYNVLVLIGISIPNLYIAAVKNHDK